MIYIIIVLFLILAIFIYFKIKHLKIGCLTFVTGGIKTGKSSLTVHLGIKHYNKAVFSWRLKSAICRLLRKKQPEKPLLYSNIPLTVPYVSLSNDILLRNERLAYKSVCIIDEASLVANSTLIKDKDINTELSMFLKLYGHETHGGKVFLTSQTVSDTHFAIKRCMDKYLHIIHSIKIPFFVLLKVREMIYSDDGGSINTFSSDIEDSTMWLFYPKSVWKKFDAYSFSYATDHLKVSNKIYKPTRKEKKNGLYLKTKNLYSFNRDYIKYYYKGVQDETKND